MEKEKLPQINLPLCTPDQCNNIVKEAFSNIEILNDEESLKGRAKLFLALGNVIRLKILSLLTVQELCICNIVEAVEGSNSTIAHHLKKLEEGRLIQSRREGKFTIYRVNTELLNKHGIFS